MGKILKIIAVIAVAVAVAVYAPQLSAALVSAGLSTSAAAAITAVASFAVTAGASFLINKVFSSAPSAAGSATPSIFRQSLSSSFIVYGKRRVGGLLIFFHPKGKDYRYFVIAVAGHRCKGAVQWYLGDEIVTVDASGLVTSGTYASNAWLWFYTGDADQQAHPTFVAETDGQWTAAHRGRGTALIYAKFKMVDAVVQAGMPNITAEIEGKDDIGDPRDGSVGYTQNAALVFYDWMALPREEGGFGSYPDELDDDWISAQASVCAEQVPLQAGGTEARYELDAYITTGAAPSEIRDTLVTCCAGSFTYSGGKMLMRPGYYVPPSATLVEDDLAGAITVPALLADDQTSNEVTGTYIDATNLYQPADAPTRSAATDEVRQSAVDLPHITSGTRAQRIMEIALRKALAERRVTWPMNIMGIAVSTLDTVQLATSRYGLSNYVFQTTSWGLASDFSVVLALEETGPEIFEWDPSMELVVGQTAPLVKATPIGAARASYRVLSQNNAFPLTSDSASITIASYTVVIDDGRQLNLPAGSVAGLTAGTTYAVFYVPGLAAQSENEDGSIEENEDGSVSQLEQTPGGYIVEAAPAIDQMASSDNVFLGWSTTSTADGTYPASDDDPPPGYGGTGSNGSLVAQKKEANGTAEA